MYHGRSISHLPSAVFDERRRLGSRRHPQPLLYPIGGAAKAAAWQGHVGSHHEDGQGRQASMHAWPQRNITKDDSSERGRHEEENIRTMGESVMKK